jgi:predicted ABC-type ATPase
VSDPVLHVLAGPNGAGKSTFFEEILRPATGLVWINADVLAATRWPGHEMEHAYDAADLAAAERARAIERRVSFATETVFSHPSKLEFLEQAKAAGYLVTVHIILVPEALSVARVAHRVEAGGHDVPETKVRQRFARLWGHLAGAIAIVDEAFVYDNSRADHPYRRVATFREGRVVGHTNWPAWTPQQLRRAGMQP